MWAVLTIVVVFDFSVGATLGRVVNRGFATLLAGTLGVGAHRIASFSGEICEPILLGLFVFILAAIHSAKSFCTEYEKSKAVADKIALDAASEGVPIVVVYPGVVYGPGKLTTGNIALSKCSHACMKCIYLALMTVVMYCSVYDNEIENILCSFQIIERFNGRLPGYIGYGNDKFSFSHVDDVVEGHLAALNKGRPGERYLLTGENASFMHVFDIAAAITETKRPWFNIPLSVIEVYGWISLFFSKITGKLPLISPPTVYVLGHQWAYSCEKAKAELGYNPRSLQEGLAEVLPWLKSLGLIKY
ncbi:hypothetical protein TEA_003333 [Camellia sinensis var. sinensis]|uniref:NAD-dependent epimerase/dehydratase domain-containing protein n=1 Tax=Camellia sinensis var. sinensis TaxID=542762 RepID=A0A4S4DT65_CAMSN|nr:hypothetical protein TEA_003333 [Camellia sinensis var. sinensis]